MMMVPLGFNHSEGERVEILKRNLHRIFLF